MPAPAYPLVLTAVEYPDLDFAPDRDAAARATELFQSRKQELTTRAHAAETIADGIASTK